MAKPSSFQVKIQELCTKYQISEELLREAIALEKEKMMLHNRRLTPKLIELIEKYQNYKK